MKSEWRVTTNYTVGGKSFQVYRLMDLNDPDGEVEFAGPLYRNKDVAKREADNLNKRDAERFWKHD